MSASSSDAILARLLGLHPKIIDLSLGRMERLLGKLGHPERRLPPTIHIAGTNGKGSTCAYLRAGLEAMGGRVHVYTSPHLARFHERIRLPDGLISEAYLSELLEECEAVNAGEPITFFEITTAAAFLAFSRVPAEWLVLEVGLGGRLDATNVVDHPRLTVITPVSLDHQSYLGETLGLIAAEKAGILKAGVPCVVGPQTPEGLEAIEARADTLKAPLTVYGRDWLAREERGRLVVQHETGLMDLPRPRLVGPHQIDNAGGAAVALEMLGATEKAIERAMIEVEWPARLQKLKYGPLLAMAPKGAEVWLDGGHNPSAGEALAAHLAEGGPAPVDLMVGMINTKDAAGFFRPLAPHVRRVCVIRIPEEQNALPAEVLAEAAGRAGLSAIACESPEEAMTRLAREKAPARRVLICGSLYFAGKLLRDHG